MAKGLAPVFFTTCGVVVAGVIGYVVIEPSFNAEKAPVIISENAPEVKIIQQEEVKTEEQNISKLETTEDVVKSEPAIKEPAEAAKVLLVKPTFDLIRVEKDGSTVVAGAGPENQIIELIDGQKKLAETKINSSGEFVIVLDKPLEPGSHELFLRVVPKDGEAIQSSSFAFVDVPKPNTLGGATVLVAEAGKPSKVLQKPEIVSTAVDVAKLETPEEVVELVKEDVSKVVSATAKTSVSLSTTVEATEEITEETTQEIAKVEEPVLSLPTTPTVDVKLAPVLIEAADIEAGKVFIAGTGEPRTTINIYLENKLLGSVVVADNGAFLFEAEKDIQAGRYDIRADMTKGSGSDVLARAEVKLVHEPKVVEIVKQEEPEPVTNELPTVLTEPEVKPEEDIVAVVENEPVVTPAVKVEAVENTETEPVVTEAPKKEIQTGNAVIIRRGDNLWTVARRNYGAGIRYTTIFDANRDQVRNPHRIYPGQVLKLPDAAQSVE